MPVWDWIPRRLSAFPVVHRPVSDSLRQALEDTEKRQNLFGPYDTAEEAVASMLED